MTVSYCTDDRILLYFGFVHALLLGGAANDQLNKIGNEEGFFLISEKGGKGE